MPMPIHTDEQRGLTLISALTNFADWLDHEGLLKSLPERERARLVLKFFDAHQPGEHYFMQAEQIMKILGEPFAKSPPVPADTNPRPKRARGAIEAAANTEEGTGNASQT